MAKTIKKSAKKAQNNIVTPLGDKVLIRPIEKPSEQKTDSGIIIPGKEGGERQERGVVVAVGKGRWDEDGEKRIPMDVSVGDKVIYVRGYEFQELKIEGVDHILISANSVLAITQ